MWWVGILTARVYKFYRVSHKIFQEFPWNVSKLLVHTCSWQHEVFPVPSGVETWVLGGRTGTLLVPSVMFTIWWWMEQLGRMMLHANRWMHEHLPSCLESYSSPLTWDVFRVDMLFEEKIWKKETVLPMSQENSEVTKEELKLSVFLKFCMLTVWCAKNWDFFESIKENRLKLPGCFLHYKDCATCHFGEFQINNWRVMRFYLKTFTHILG